MTVTPARAQPPTPVQAQRLKALLMQVLIVILINVPTMSFGLALGWVSLASGESGSNSADGGSTDGGSVVWGAAVTFCAQLVGVPLSARAAAAGRKPALIATSFAFVVCWSLKLGAMAAGGAAGGWLVLAARGAAGLGGAGAWTLAPLLAGEMCSAAVCGAGAVALVLAHNLGFLLMYLAADLRTPHSTVLYWCLGLSACHCVAYVFVPESPAFLAANGKLHEARASLSVVRARRPEDPVLALELASLPPPDEAVAASWAAPFVLIKEMLSERGRRRAFIIVCVAVVGQEACGVFALLQFAERVFVVARGGADAGGAGDAGAAALHELSPARRALWLGVVQLVASAAALYLVEKLGRRVLLVSTAWITSASLFGGAAALQWAGPGAGARWAALALAACVAADSAGVQPVPYALLADMFHYQYRGCAVSLVMALACAGNALEVVWWGALAGAGGAGGTGGTGGVDGAGAGAGLRLALLGSGLVTALYAVFATTLVPETRGKTPEQIYQELDKKNNKGNKDDINSNVISVVTELNSKETIVTNM